VSVAPDGGDLCQQCGLCCDGSLFSHITMTAPEREFVESLGLVVESDGNEVWATEPCPAFVEGCCSLYERGRPATCITYECGLLKGYTLGQAVLDDCLGVVRLVWSLARTLELEMGLPIGGYNRRAMQAFLDEVRPWEDQGRYETLLVTWYRLDLLGKKYFSYSPKPTEVAAAAAGQEVAEASASG
jgi:hypothetical protein